MNKQLTIFEDGQVRDEIWVGWEKAGQKLLSKQKRKMWIKCRLNERRKIKKAREMTERN